jgi:CRISPR/Cas system-associated exonuclease Cas4 (RecB family)
MKNICRLLDSVNKEVPVERDFLNDLKRSIEMTEDKYKRKPSQTYKPSGMQCIRNMYYQVSGTEQDNGSSNYTLIGICNSGTDIHDRTQKAIMLMKDNGIDCEYIDVAEYVKSRNLDYLDIVSKTGNETKLYHKELNISFLCDGIIRYKGHYYILELKTENSYKWQIRQGVDEKHFNQGIAYSLAFGIDEVIFVYISRDILDMKAFMFNVTDEMKKSLLDKINDCNGYVERQITPPKPENITNKICAYCSYKNTCKKEM